jgi:hypothetical protein
MEDQGKYQKGFNDGHRLAQYQPELWEKVKSSLSQENDYEKGLIEGALEFQQNKEKTRGEELENIRNGKDKDRDLTPTR